MKNESQLVLCGFTKLQSKLRVIIAKKTVENMRVQTRAIIRIQRNVRGHMLRSRMMRKRIEDIHFCASNNKKERLEYYCTRYLELTFVKDSSGNSALHNACKRSAKKSIKCLIKHGHDPLEYNPEGFDALHLVVLSSGPERDECFMYLKDHGSDIHRLAYDRRSCLMLAVQYERVCITNACLQQYMDPNDLNGYTTSCLQLACITGYEIMAKLLIENGANVNMADPKGKRPLHDVTISGNMEIAKMLVRKGANINVCDLEVGSTPLMLACARGLKDMVEFFLMEGGDVHSIDYYYRNVAHYLVQSDNGGIVNCLREADTNFDALDYEGNSPLHLACEAGAENVAREMLHTGANAVIQNLKGNQPSHIAAQFNRPNILKLLIPYDEHIGRTNFSHQTPLGIAKFYLSHDARKFLEDHFAKEKAPRNEKGDIWWDQKIDHITSDWRVEVDYSNHRIFVNDITGERTLKPPTLSYSMVKQIAQYAQIPQRLKVQINLQENVVNRHVYNSGYSKEKEEKDHALQLFRKATIIQKFARMKLARLKVIRMKKANKKMIIMYKFLKRCIKVVKSWKVFINSRKLTKVQALFRGYIFRCHFYYWDMTYKHLWYELQKRRTARKVWNAWKRFKSNKLSIISKLLVNGPKLMSEWEAIFDICQKPVRTIGVYEEYCYPYIKFIKFYRNTVNGDISFMKPKLLNTLDAADHKIKEQLRKLGYTPAELKLALKVQSLWRGHVVRKHYIMILKASNICIHAEEDYLKNPDSDKNLFNYALYCHVVANDLNRARNLYREVLRRMQFRGPDIPQILYGYSIFAMITHDQDIHDCLMYAEKAKLAEYENFNFKRRQRQKQAQQLTELEIEKVYKKVDVTQGKTFELALLGFYRRTANLKQTSAAWHNLAVCEFLVQNDFVKSFDAFMNAIKTDPMNKKIAQNYWEMMRYYFPSQNEIEAFVTKRMQYRASREQDERNARQARIDLAKKKNTCALRIQV